MLYRLPKKDVPCFGVDYSRSKAAYTCNMLRAESVTRR